MNASELVQCPNCGEILDTADELREGGCKWCVTSIEGAER